MFDKRLKQLRIERKISQKKVAEFLNINQRTYASYENNEREPNSKLLIAIANFFNVSIDFLLGVPQNENNITENYFLQVDEVEMLKKYRQLNSDGKKHLNSTIDMCLLYYT